MGIGERRFRVVFQQPTIAQDAFGEPDKTWTTLCTRWALVQPIRGKEKFSMNQTQVDVDHRIVARYDSKTKLVGAGDRITWDGHTYDIKSAIWRNHMKKEIEFLAQEHVA